MAAITVLDGVNFNSEGYMADPGQWTKDVAEVIAVQEGIVLTSEHWKVINFCRQTTLGTGKSPTMRAITNGVGITTKDLFALFPGGPAKKVAKIAGVGKPEGCV